MSPLLLQAFFGGLTSGSVYAMIAIGFALVYRSTGIINFAHGEFVMLGALLAISVLAGLKLPVAVAALIAVLGAAAIGAAMERLLMRPVRLQPPFVAILLTVAASYLSRGTAMNIWGKDPLPLPSFSGDQSLFIAGAAVVPQAIWILAAAVMTVILLSVFLNRTVYGKALRACAENPRAASLVGINVGSMTMLSFALSASIGAMAGILITPMTGMDFQMGFVLAMKGLTGAIIGGLDRVSGVIAGALLLGLIEGFAAAYISSLMKESISFLVLIIILAARPQGLLSSRRAQ
jgi:branched-chain amino acid transport system permease protein